MLFPPPKPPQPRRVVVTGAGIITAFGAGWKINAEGFRSGRTAFRPVTLFDVSRQRCKIAAEIDLPGNLPPNRLSRGRFATAAARLAPAPAGRAGSVDSIRLDAGRLCSVGPRHDQRRNVPRPGISSPSPPIALLFQAPGVSASRIIWCSSRGSIWPTPSASRQKSSPSPTPVPRGPTPSDTLGNWCAKDGRRGF